MTEGVDIAIIGYGFSGGMVLANVIRQAHHSCNIAILDASPHAMKGPAYATPHPFHVLNVRAEAMGAWPDHPAHFYHWLTNRPEGNGWQPSDFVPRGLYGAYLHDIQRESLALATKKQIQVRHTAQHVTAILPHTDDIVIHRHEAEPLRARQVVLACGNSFGALSPHISAHRTINQLLAAPPTHRHAPLALLGSGLTAMDALLHLGHGGYKGPIHCLSRHGRIPQPHATYALPSPLDIPATFRMNDALNMHLRTFTRLIRSVTQWHSVFDALRPHTVALWQSLSVQDQKRFMKHLMSLWNTHRHRMDPKWHAYIQRMTNVEIYPAHVIDATTHSVTYAQHNRVRTRAFEAVIDCRGPHYRHIPAFTEHAVHMGMLKPHPLGGWITSDGAYRISPKSTGAIYAMGAQLFGERFETLAVPELRIQAEQLARTLLQTFKTP